MTGENTVKSVRDIIKGIFNNHQEHHQPEEYKENIKKGYIKVGIVDGDVAYVFDAGRSVREQIIDNPNLAMGMTIKKLKEISGDGDDHDDDYSEHRRKDTFTIPAAPYIAMLEVGEAGPYGEPGTQIIKDSTIEGLVSQASNVITNEPAFQKLQLRALVETQSIIRDNMTKQQEQHVLTDIAFNWYGHDHLKITTILTSALHQEDDNS